MYRKPNLSQSPSSTTKSTATKSNTNGADDENWKLLKFLCDRIEENQKRESQAKLQQEIEEKSQRPTQFQIQPQSQSQSQPPKPLPIPFTNILAKRKKKNKTFLQNNNQISPPSKNHFKTKSQALYTSALKDKNS